jgi:hypothetical protein
MFRDISLNIIQDVPPPPPTLRRCWNSSSLEERSLIEYHRKRIINHMLTAFEFLKTLQKIEREKERMTAIHILNEQYIYLQGKKIMIGKHQKKYILQMIVNYVVSVE